MHAEDLSGVAAAAAELRRALESLTRLRALTLDVSIHAPLLEWVPAALPGLARLQSFSWLSYRPHLDAALLPGEWLQGLQALALPAHLAMNSLPQLLAATQLQRLTTFGTDTFGWGTALLHWATQHPSLQNLAVRAHGIPAGERPEVFASAAVAKARNPGLAIELDPALS